MKESIINPVWESGRTYINIGEAVYPQDGEKGEGARLFSKIENNNNTVLSSAYDLGSRSRKYEHDRLFAQIKISKEPLLEYVPSVKNEQICMISLAYFFLFVCVILIVGLLPKFRSLSKFFRKSQSSLVNS